MTPITSLLSDLVSDVVLTRARVTEVGTPAPGFIRVSLRSDAFRRTRWTPGDKVQLRAQRGSLVMRTYTPVRWDREEGTTELIAFEHGDGPGARWFHEAAMGTGCEVFGPSRSLALPDVSTSAIFVGDETSVGLAHALRGVEPSLRCLYEASDTAALSTVLTALGHHENVAVVAKSDDRTALVQLIRATAQTCLGPYQLVVSGDAASVSAIRRGSATWPEPPARVSARAYWARGRTGLS